MKYKLLLIPLILFSAFGLIGTIALLSEGDLSGAIFFLIWMAIGILFIFLLLRVRQKNINKSNNLAVKSTQIQQQQEPTSSNDLLSKPSFENGSANQTIIKQPQKKTEHHHIAGTSFRQKEIRTLGYENDTYSLPKRDLMDLYNEYDKIYQIEFSPKSVQLLEEFDNPHDPNAIKVVIDGVHVGYIKKGSCSHIKKLIKNNQILGISAEIHGGKYKQLIPDEDDSYMANSKETFSLEINNSDFYVSIYINVLTDNAN